MKFLLDTCAISELIKPAPHPGVLDWFAECDEFSLALSAVSIGELKRGMEKLEEGKRKSFLRSWLEENVVLRFGQRILPADEAVFLQWGALQARLESAGTPMPAFDALIAATALQYGLTVVTRNVRDMQPSGVALVNPWEGQP